MNTKIILLSGLAVAGGLALAGMIFFRPSARPETARANPKRLLVPEQPGHAPPPPVTSAPAPQPSPAEQAGNLSDSAPPPKAKPDAPQKVSPPSAPSKKPKPPLQDPAARVAMSLVGVDPDAEAYWCGAIFDSSLPDGEREDLMEDLNEEGLSDPKRPGPQDIPVIMNRLVIIEEIVPHADEFMLRHLAEAYKDLLNLAQITQGGGKPVR